MGRTVLGIAACAMVAYGARALYFDARYLGVSDCTQFLSVPAARTYAQLRGCRVEESWRVAVPAASGVAAATYAAIVGEAETPDSVRLLVRDSDLRAADFDTVIAGKLVDGDNALRIAIAESDLPLAFHWRLLEPKAPPSGAPAAGLLVAGAALAAGLMLRRNTSPASTKGAVALESPAAGSVYSATGTRQTPATVAFPSVDVKPVAEARRRLRFALWALTPISGIPAFAVGAAPVESIPGGFMVQGVVTFALLVIVNIMVRRAAAHIPGSAARRVERIAWWSAAGVAALATLTWGTWHSEPALAFAIYALWTLLAFGIAAHSIAALNGFAEPKLDLREGALLRSYGNRPGMFASGRYVAVIGWSVITALGWIAGIFIGLVIVAINYISPINLVKLLFPRTVKPLLFQASRAGQRRRRYGSPSARAIMLSDRRAPVLLLRSFADDDMQGRENGEWFRSADTFEEVVADRLWSFGPVVAIGQPGEPIPRAGAAREYVSHDEWKHRVHALATEAALIVLVIGRTPGIVWELENASRMGVLSKTVLLIPPGTAGEADERVTLLRHMVSDPVVASKLAIDLPSNALALLLGSEPPVALTAPERKARFYEEAVGLAARTVIGQRPRLRGEAASARAERVMRDGKVSGSRTTII